MFYDIFTRPLSRRRFLAGGVKSLAAACLGAVFSPITKALAASSPDVRFVRQIVAADNRTARTIMWQSAHEQRSAAVEWRRPGAKEIQSVAATSAPFSDDGHASFQHTACLTGLPPQSAWNTASSSGGRSLRIGIPSPSITGRSVR